MKFGKEFTADLKEAFEYFKDKQVRAAAGNPEAQKQIKAVKLDMWVASMLRKPVYDLLGEKRILPEDQ